jgi:hypothetical protein
MLDLPNTHGPVFLFFEAHQRLAKENPQAIGALGGFCLELRPLGRVGDVGGQGAHARARLRLAGRQWKPPLPFGPVPLHVRMRRVYGPAHVWPARS